MFLRVGREKKPEDIGINMRPIETYVSLHMRGNDMGGVKSQKPNKVNTKYRRLGAVEMDLRG